MAMIKCSECGQLVSDRAKTCIHCGNPLEKPTYTVKFKVAKDDKFYYWDGKYVLTDDKTGKELARLSQNQSITLELPEPTTLRCHFGMYKDAILDYVPREGVRRYNIDKVDTLFKSYITFNEVDVFDGD